MKKATKKDEEETYSGVIIDVIEPMDEIKGEEQDDKGGVVNSVSFDIVGDKEEYVDEIARRKGGKERRK